MYLYHSKPIRLLFIFKTHFKLFFNEDWEFCLLKLNLEFSESFQILWNVNVFRYGLFNPGFLMRQDWLMWQTFLMLFTLIKGAAYPTIKTCCLFWETVSLMHNKYGKWNNNPPWLLHVKKALWGCVYHIICSMTTIELLFTKLVWWIHINQCLNLVII